MNKTGDDEVTSVKQQARELDPERIRQAMSGDPLAFDALVIFYKDLVFNLLRRLGVTSIDADDLTQNVFMKIWKSREHFQTDRSFKSWLIAIVMNEWRTWVRTRSRRRVFPFSIKRSTSGEDEPEVVEYEDPNVDLNHELNRKMMMEQVMKAVNRLPVELREVYLLREIEELSYAEIAFTVDVAEGTVKSRLNRARNSLMNELRSVFND